MSPAATEDQRSPLMPIIKQHQAMLELPELRLPTQFSKGQLQGGGGFRVDALCSDERLSSSSSVADMAEEYAPSGETTPSEGGESASSESDPWAESLPAEASPERAPGAWVPSSFATPFEPDAEPNAEPDEEEAHSAIQALLSLQREASPALGPALFASSDSSSSSSYKDACVFARAHAPSTLLGAISKSDPTIRFYCRYPSCGKGYASTDAVRKHCRQRHLEWLRRLGHGCPALYCKWEE